MKYKIIITTIVVVVAAFVSLVLSRPANQQAAAPLRLEVFPAQVTLTTQRDRQSVVVVATWAGKTSSRWN